MTLRREGLIVWQGELTVRGVHMVVVRERKLRNRCDQLKLDVVFHCQLPFVNARLCPQVSSAPLCGHVPQRKVVFVLLYFEIVTGIMTYCPIATINHSPDVPRVACSSVVVNT